METSNFSITEEELIASTIHSILTVFKVHSFFSERIGFEISLQNGLVCGSSLNFYKTKPGNIGNISCIAPSLSPKDKDSIKRSAFQILKTLKMNAPEDLFGNMEIISEFDPERKMRIKNVSVNIRSVFKLYMN